MLWIKAFHVIFIVCWFAGLFYLPRLFVYHATCKDEVGDQRFKIMERRLYYGIMMPSAVLTVVFGLWLVSLNPAYYVHADWFNAKMVLVIILILYHFYCGHCRKLFRDGKNKHSEKFYRWFNEFPVVILIAVVILAVVKPMLS